MFLDKGNKNNKNVGCLTYFLFKKKKKTIKVLRRSGLVGECSYFVGNVLVQVRHVFLPFYPSVLSLLKPRGVGIFWNKKKKIWFKQGKPLK